MFLYAIIAIDIIRRMLKSLKKPLLTAFLMILLLGGCDHEPGYSLVKVIDGDSLLLNKIDCIEDCRVEVRMLGMDAPEFKQDPWGRRAWLYLKANISDNVDLEFDVDKTDKYGRTLAYVFNDDGKFVNEMMLDMGYAVLYSSPKNKKYVTELKKAEANAKAKKDNIWHEEKGMEMTPSEFRKFMKKIKEKHFSGQTG